MPEPDENVTDKIFETTMAFIDEMDKRGKLKGVDSPALKQPNFAPHTKSLVPLTPSDVAKIARSIGISPPVLIACIGTESSFDKEQLYRYEPEFEKWLRKQIKGLSNDEYRNRSASWGVGHVMGQTLKEMQFCNEYEVLLTDHSQAAHWCARYLRRCYERARKLTKWTEALEEENKTRKEKKVVTIPYWPKGCADVWEAAICAYNTGGFKKFPEAHINRFRWWRDRAHRFGFPEERVR